MKIIKIAQNTQVAPQQVQDPTQVAPQQVQPANPANPANPAQPQAQPQAQVNPQASPQVNPQVAPAVNETSDKINLALTKAQVNKVQASALLNQLASAFPQASLADIINAVNSAQAQTPTV